MSPEQAANVRSALIAAIGDDHAGKDRLQSADKYVRGQGAYLVATGVLTPSLAGSVAALGFGQYSIADLTAYYAQAIRRIADRIAEELGYDEDQLAYHLSWLIERRAPAATLRKIARNHAGRLPDWQVEAIIKREQAWWVRCNAQLEQAA